MCRFCHFETPLVSIFRIAKGQLQLLRSLFDTAARPNESHSSHKLNIELGRKLQVINTKTESVKSIICRIRKKRFLFRKWRKERSLKSHLIVMDRLNLSFTRGENLSKTYLIIISKKGKKNKMGRRSEMKENRKRI